VVFLVLIRRLVAGGVLKRSALSISVRSSLERVDRWLISFWEPWWAVFHGVVVDEKIFAWSLAAMTSAAASDGEGAAPGT
jgi:hypothetical protein